MDETFSQLLTEYCPPIDSALFFAIISDYDLSTPDALHRARETLEALKDSAAAEEATGFDPSGSSALENGTTTDAHGESERAQSSSEEVASRTKSVFTDLSGTADSSYSQSLLDLASGYPGSGPAGDDGCSSSLHHMGLEGLDVASKEAALKTMFPTVKPFTISHTLKKSGTDVDKTIEELLSQVFLEEELDTDGECALQRKGIDGFVENDAARKRRGKGKKKRLPQDDRFTSSVPAPLAEADVNQWEAARRDVEFICQKTGLPMQTVSSQYHKHGASLPDAIRALLDMASSEQSASLPDDSTIRMCALELGQEFPTISSVHLTAIVRMTHPSTASAHELAKALTTMPQHKSPTGGIELITKYRPVDLTEGASATETKRSATQNLGLPMSTAGALAAANTAARQTAFDKASAAYRRGKSDHLMGAVAGYYSSLGREYDANAKKYASAAADALVESQSRAGELDLHGVSVKDAVRIASEKVTAWWAGLGDARFQRTSTPRYRIVTGMGRHSEGGKGKIGPAVAKMLVREGWKVEIGEGVLVVTGVLGRK